MISFTSATTTPTNMNLLVAILIYTTIHVHCNWMDVNTVHSTRGFSSTGPLLRRRGYSLGRLLGHREEERIVFLVVAGLGEQLLQPVPDSFDEVRQQRQVELSRDFFESFVWDRRF